MAGYYLPSVKGGGPIQSIRNLVDNFGDEIDFYILAADRDLGDEKPFKSVIVDKWTKVEKALVYYTDMSYLNWKKIENIIKDIQCNILYLNSFFAYKDSILPILLYKYNRNFNMKVILAPRGQFSKGALGLKSWKKRIFINLGMLFNLYKKIYWHATTIMEKEDIECIFGKEIEVFTANNLTPNYRNIQCTKSLSKNVGVLKLVYIARIHPMKNLLQTLEILQRVEGIIEFNIYGPIEDKSYWNKCQLAINKLNQNIKVNYMGQIANEQVNAVYNEHHVAILLTLGENFGHSIAEALIGGCPVIISDRTPWKNLKNYGVGYDISLEKDNLVVEAIHNYTKMDNYEYELISRNAFDYAKNNSNTKENLDSYYEMFEIRNNNISGWGNSI